MRKLDAEALAEKIRSKHLNPENIWKDVESLHPFGATPLKTSCEVAFARVAIMKSIIARTQAPLIRGELFGVLDRLIAAEFDDTGSEAILLYGQSLRWAANRAISLYYAQAQVPAKLTALFVQRIEASPSRVLSTKHLFETFGNDFGTSLRKYRFKIHSEPVRRFGFLQLA